jgi:tetratricopeptide (TPR) repeat protein
MYADRPKADALLQQARTNRSNPTMAREKVDEAIRLYRQVDDGTGLADALMFLGQLDRDAGRGDEALPHYEEAIALARADGDKRILAHRVRHLGDLHQDAGRLEAAAPFYAEALALYRQGNLAGPLELANALRGFALLQDARGDRAQARELWSEAKTLYATGNVPAGVAECSVRLARLD